MSKRALITGIGGQDGSYMADLLLAKGYEVHGLHRHSSVDNLRRLREAGTIDRVTLHRGDVTDWVSLFDTVWKSQPDEVYHLADQDNVGWSRAAPSYQLRVTGMAVRDLLEICSKFPAKLFVPLSATMFGSSPPPQNEEAFIDPQSPYATSKVAAWLDCEDFRERGLHVVCGIMFNHDSPRRNEGYLLGRIAKQAVELARGERARIKIGNPSTVVDIGFAGDFMDIAWRLMQLPQPDDYCVGTGQGVAIRELICQAVYRAGGRWEGEHQIEVDPDYAEVQPTLVADTTKLKKALGWHPDSKDLNAISIVKMLVDHIKG